MNIYRSLLLTIAFLLGFAQLSSVGYAQSSGSTGEQADLESARYSISYTTLLKCWQQDDIKYCKDCYGNPTDVIATGGNCDEAQLAQSEMLVDTASLIDTYTLNHHHFAADYRIGRGSSSCSSCSSGVGSGAALFDFDLERRHRYRDMTTYSSFGPGVFSSYDTKLSIFEYDGGTIAYLFSPKDLTPRRFVDGLEGDTKDGVLQNLNNKGFEGLRLYDSTDILTSSLSSAAKAVVTAHSGVKHTFELFSTDSFTGVVGGQSVSPLINPDALPDADLIAHWEFDGTGTTAVDSEGTYDATITSGTRVTSTAPSGGSAIRFSGTPGQGVDGGNVPVGSVGDPQGGFTAAFWVNPGMQTASQPALLSKNNGPDGERSFLLDRFKISGVMRFIIYLDGTNATMLSTPQQVLVKDKWQHVAITYDGSYQRIFVNGQQVARSQDLDTPFTVARSSDLVIGNGGVGNSAFIGDMDDVRIYDRALIGAELQALMQREIQGSYDLEENTGLTTADSSGNGNDGTLFGGASWTTSGYSGNAIDFDGVDDGVNLGNDPSLLSAHLITVSAWIKPDTLANASTGDGSRNIAARGNGVFLRIKDGEYQFGTSTVGFINPAKVAAPSSDIGQWVHLAGAYDGHRWMLYRNGVLVAENFDERGSSSIDDDWVIGNTADGTKPFDGVIDSVRIYNDTLSADEIVSASDLPILSGRLTRIEDRNGFAKTLTYRDADFTAQELIDAPDRRWQINTVTDAYGREATFHYKSTQESGRWVVEKVDLPNGQDVDYVYDNNKLDKVTHADGTESNFAYGVDSLSQTTTVQYRDASAVGTHRNKTVYLTNIITMIETDKTTDIYNQASLLVRLVANGNNEVSFMAIPQDSHNTMLYTGTGKVGIKYDDEYVRYYSDGWSFSDPDDYADGITGTLETNFAKLDTINIGADASRGVYPNVTDKHGNLYTYNYDNDSFVTRKVYAYGIREDWAYNQFKQVTRYSDRLGRVTLNTYDAAGNLTKKETGLLANGTGQIAQPEYAKFEYAYYSGSEGPAVSGITGAAATQPKGLKKSDTDANGNVTHYVYNSDNFRIAMIEPADRPGDDRAVTLYAYDSAGRMTSVTDPLGRVMSFAYDARDRQKTVTYEDGSTTETFYANELTGGAGGQANLIVAEKDRNGNYTQYRHDGHGRRVTTIRGITTQADALDQSSFILDTTYHDVEECVYLAGSNKKIICMRNGERTEYVYDYRQRQIATTVFPRDEGVFPFNANLVDPDGTGPLAAGDDPGKLVSTTIYKDNLRFASIDPYGRATFYAYRANDSAMIRTVKETVPGGSGIDPQTGTFAQVINLTRDLSFEDAATIVSSDRGGATYLITDMVKDIEEQVTSTVDPRNIQHDAVYDSRGRTIESITAVGTTEEAKSETIYDAQSNVIASRSPRYFDSGDTEGFNKAFTTMTYTGRNLLASKTVAAGDTTYDTFVTSGGTSGGGAKATEVVYYYLDGRHEKTIDYNGNDPQFTAAEHTWLTVWRACCERIRATIDPEGHGQAQGTDFNGNVTHTAVVDSLINDVVIDGTTGARTIANSDDGGPGIWDAPDDRTLAETTTRFDSKNRPVASTVWLEKLAKVDPNDPPILYGGSIQGGTNAQTAATGVSTSAGGLTTLYYYSEDIYETLVISAGIEGPPVRGVGEDNAYLVHQFSAAPTISLNPSLAIIDDLNILITREDYTTASARATINPEGEISLTIMDGLGRPVFSAMLDPTTFAPVTWSTVSHDRVSDAIATTYGDTLETLSISALEHLNRSFTDGAGRTIEVQDAEGEVSFAVYDNNGNTIRTRNANAVGQDCDFDARNREVSCTDTHGDTITRTYNAGNQVLKVTDAKGVANKADTVFDARGRAIESTSRLDIADKNFRGYDPNGNLLTQTDAQGGTTTYEYDPRNLRIAKLMPGHNPGSVVGDSDYDRAEMAFDAMRRPLLKTDQQGDTVVYTYDLASRLLTRDYRTFANSTPGSNGLPSGTIADTDTFTYDDASRPLTAIKGRYANTVTFAYDNIGRPTSEALTTHGQTYTTGYTNYDDDSRLTVLTYPDGSTVTTSFTDRNQAEGIDYKPFGGTTTTLATMTYDAGMRHTSAALGNGLTPTYAYRAPGTGAPPSSGGDNMLGSITVAGRAGLSLDYTYDANKNMTAEATGGVMEDFSIDLVQDAKDRMTSWARSGTGTGLDSQDWTLSFESNWDETTRDDGVTPITESRTHNAAHELLTIDPDSSGNNPFSQTHDAKGNLTADGDGLAHTFDFDNMLKQVVVAGASPRGIEGTHTYAYDALGRRVSKSVDTDSDNIPDVTTVFVCAGQQVIAEYEGGAATTAPERKYIFCATGYIDEPIAMIDASGSGEDTYYYHRNRQFSIVGLTDDTGTVIERYAYTAYGEVTVLDANAAADADGISDVLNPYTYTGRRLDDETGLLYFRARYHDPVLGRFLERDPLGYPDGLNTYAAYYVMWGGVDPWGMKGEEVGFFDGIIKNFEEGIAAVGDYLTTGDPTGVDPNGGVSAKVFELGFYKYVGLGGGGTVSLTYENVDCCTPSGTTIRNGKKRIIFDVHAEAGIGAFIKFSAKAGPLGLGTSAGFRGSRFELDVQAIAETKCGGSTFEEFSVSNSKTVFLGIDFKAKLGVKANYTGLEQGVNVLAEGGLRGTLTLEAKTSATGGLSAELYFIGSSDVTYSWDYNLPLIGSDKGGDNWNWNTGGKKRVLWKM